VSRTLIQIVASLPPSFSGVGDYALGLACALRQDFGIDTLFLMGNTNWQGPERIKDFPVYKLAASSAGSLEATLESLRTTNGASSVLLQLSIYGYARRGCPFWLLAGLKRWRSNQRPNSRLVTMFHELYASGPPWGSAFWLSAAQKNICAGLTRLSDAAMTNLHVYQEELERFDPTKRGRIPVLAIPSNVGEPVTGDLDSRCRNMVVFGLAPLRNRTYKTHMFALQQACQQLGITEIHDVGTPIDGVPDCVGDVPILKHGQMEASDLSSLLSHSMAGFLNYGPGLLSKSSVFGAYCAHRLLPVTPEDLRSEANGIVCGVHYYCAAGMPTCEPTASNAQRIADAAWDWHQGHSSKRHARVVAEALGS
jgi:hypothetical protein